jgi:ferrochelatase
MVENIEKALAKIPASRQKDTLILYTAHSIPLSMAKGCEYEKQYREACTLVSGLLSIDHWQLAYQSRSGPPHRPWLEPDILDTIDEVVKTGHQDIIVAPIGFISDHMEVIYDLDVEAAEKASKVGLNMIRSETVGTHPVFVEMIRELILERMEGIEKRYLGSLGPAPDYCRDDCCSRHY